jgi:cell division protease FtsH
MREQRPKSRHGSSKASRKKSRTPPKAPRNPPRTAMGPLTLAVFEREGAKWKAMRRALNVESAAAGASASCDGASASTRVFRKEVTDEEHSANFDGAQGVAAQLMLARAIDAHDGLLASICGSAPVVIFDVPDASMLGLIRRSWREVIFGDAMLPSAFVDSQVRTRKRQSLRTLHLFVTDDEPGSKRGKHSAPALDAIALALPLLAFSPSGTHYLPAAILRASEANLSIGRPDADTIAQTIRIVTGERPRGSIEPSLLAKIGIEEIAVAIRFDRSAAECMEKLKRLAAQGLVHAGPRELRLDQLHGMDDAVAWAKSFVRDVEAWRRGEVAWGAAIEAGVCFEGPPGTGKTTLAKVIAAEAGLKLTVGSLGKWQGAGEGHLGDLLREMRHDMHASEGGIMFVDELSSFGDRNSFTHAYRNYSVQVVNAFLELCDGISGSDALGHQRSVLIGATNDASAIDPAILRSGRFNKIIRINLPDVAALERMLRVRLRGDLADVDLGDVALAATGCSGADVERIVKDARRYCRHAGRDLTLDDLKRAVCGDVEVPAPLLPRVAIHEAGHVLVDVLLHGPDGVIANMVAVGSRAAASFRLAAAPLAGTYDDHFRELQVMFAGRAAEQATFGLAGAGSGWAGSSSSDLAQASSRAAAMVGSWGLTDSPLFLAPAAAAPELLAFTEVRGEARELLRRAEAACALLISANRASLDVIALRLLADGRVTGAEVARIIRQNRSSAAKDKEKHEQA